MTLGMRDEAGGTNGQSSANETQSAAHLLSTHDEDEGSQGWCYFIGGEDGAIKIGFAADVRKRLKQLQLSCPVTLKILAKVYGGKRRETDFHIQFCRDRLHGEWFKRTPELLETIERLRA